jgi:transglutaminase-like putative cysteine protease
LLGQHSLLLRPREGHELHVVSFTLKSIPEAKILWHRDVEDNSVAIVNFNQVANNLLIESEVIIEQYNEFSLNFIVSEYAIFYPFIYKHDERFLLAPYMVLPEQKSYDVLKNWIYNFYTEKEVIQTYTLLLRISRYIHDNLSYTCREEPGVQTVIETLSIGSGSCRDFAFLFMETVKCLGLASRFVSGYLYDPLMFSQIGSTHAWAEVYLPGAGWKGFDPTIGDIVGKDHIPVAVSRLAEAVPPISGSFSGVATSTLEVGVWVSHD